MSDSHAADPAAYPYATFLNVLFPQLEKIDVPALADAVTDRWYNQTLCQVNDSVVRLGVMQGEYHWHSHQDLDEFFYVVEGRLDIELEEFGPEFLAGHGTFSQNRSPAATARSESKAAALR